MGDLKMKLNADALSLFDERGGLVGTILRPVSRDPVGPGRETVYLARGDARMVKSATPATMASRPGMTEGAEAA
jgi:hypothetical protein